MRPPKVKSGLLIFESEKRKDRIVNPRGVIGQVLLKGASFIRSVVGVEVWSVEC